MIEIRVNIGKLLFSSAVPSLFSPLVKVTFSTVLNTSTSEINTSFKLVSVELKPVVAGWTVVIFSSYIY